jgi:hypothetical protein
MAGFVAQSHRRHVTYCRRTQEQPRKRRKSCYACNAAKVRCSFQQCCSRCRSKGLDCVYDDPRRPPVDSELPAKEPNISDSSGSVTSSHGERPTTLEPGRNSSSATTASSQPRPIEVGNNVPALQPSPVNEDVVPIYRGFSNSANDAIEALAMQHIGSVTAMGTLTKKTLTSTSSDRAAILMIQSLRGYPERMLLRDNLPPFIHTKWYDNPPEPLAICISVASMFSKRRPNDQFLWRTILTEQLRLAQSVSTLVVSRRRPLD